MELKLIEFNHEQDIMINLIISFWKEHNSITPTYEDALSDLKEWSKEGNRLYFISFDNNFVGFLHLGSRGCEPDWLENIYVLKEYQNKGIGTSAIKLVEDIVKEYSESLYIEAAARNYKVIRLYHRIGYTCLNTITIRKDFNNKYENIGKEKILDLDFDIKK